MDNINKIICNKVKNNYYLIYKARLLKFIKKIVKR